MKNERMFDESIYLITNPDVADGVKKGLLESGYTHFQKIGCHQNRISNASQYIESQAKKIFDLQHRVYELDSVVLQQSKQIASQNIEIQLTHRALQAMQHSLSWKVTWPLRVAAVPIFKAIYFWKDGVKAIRLGGGFTKTLLLTANVLKNEGFRGIHWRLQAMRKLGNPGQVMAGAGNTFDAIGSSSEGVLVLAPASNDYAEWIRRYDTVTDDARAIMRTRIDKFASLPLISVVMPTYNSNEKWLKEAIESVRSQIYPHWELCIADDASTEKAVRALLERYAKEDTRIKVVYREKNGHISAASNSALTLATGQWAALLDHDDLLTEHALFWVADAINNNPQAGLIYSDEDKINPKGERYDSYFKCDLNPELLLAQNMICHLGVYKLDLVKRLGGFREGFEGAQDYDLALRVIEQLSPKQVIHIPRVLYHWRAIPGSTALNASEKNYAANAGRAAVAEHLKRQGKNATVSAAPDAPALNRVRFELPAILPLVSVIIPTRDRVDLLATCIQSMLKLTTYPAFEIVIMDNGSVEAETIEFFASLPDDRVRVVRDDSPFNFSALNNHGARVARGELFCLVNNDIEFLTPDWLEEMVSFALLPEVGCVGARLWYPDGRLQHGGVVVGVGGVAGHSHKYHHRGQTGYFGRTVLHQSFSSVTAACLLVRRSVFEAVNGLDEALAIAFNDIDFCLRVQAAGYRNVWTPYAEMTHHESVSRGHENTPEKQARFSSEVYKMQARWGKQLLLDPAYSPNLTLDCEDFSLAWPPRLELM